MMACNCRALQPQVTRLSPDINTNDSYASVETHDSHSQSSRFIPDAIKALRLSFAGHDLPSSSNSSLSPQNASAFWQQGKAQNGSTPVGIGQMPDAHEHIQDQQRYQQAAPQPQAGFNPRTLANSPADAIEAMCDIRDAVELDHSVLSGLKRKQETRLDVCSAHLSRAGPYSNPPSKMQKMPGRVVTMHAVSACSMCRLVVHGPLCPKWVRT